MERLAKAAYDAYCVAVGLELPPFSTLRRIERTAWVAAAEAVRAVDFLVDN